MPGRICVIIGVAVAALAGVGRVALFSAGGVRDRGESVGVGMIELDGVAVPCPRSCVRNALTAFHNCVSFLLTAL